MSSSTPPPPSSEATNVKEDHLNSRILRYFNIPPSLSSSPPTLTNHRKSKTYALSAVGSEHEMLPANEARQFTNKDTVMYLEPGTNSTALGHEIWRLWYPLRRRDAFGKESNLLESFFASPIRTAAPITSLAQQIQAHQALMSRIEEIQDDIEADHMPNTDPGWSKGKFRVSEGCRSCFLIVGKAWAEEGVRIVCQEDILMSIGGDGEVGWRDVDLDDVGADDGEEQMGKNGMTGKKKGWKWRFMSLDEAVRAVIKIGGEEGRFEEKGVSQYFKEYYDGENWRENFAM